MNKRLIAAITFFTTLAAVPVFAQSTRLKLDFPDLAARASESVDVDLDGQLLRLAGKFLASDDDSNDKDEQAVRDMIAKLQGIYVKSYTFDKENAYGEEQVRAVRSQLGPTWKKIVNVRNKKDDNVEIYTDVRNGAIVGLVILAAEPKEFTVVNLVGPVDLDRLSAMEGQFGIPKISHLKPTPAPMPSPRAMPAPPAPPTPAAAPTPAPRPRPTE